MNAWKMKILKRRTDYSADKLLLPEEMQVSSVVGGGEANIKRICLDIQQSV